MINKIVKLLTNPQGALVQLILDQVAKVFKLDKVLRYVEEDNEIDIAVKNIEHKCTEIDLKIKAMQSIISDIDNINNEEIQKIKKVTDNIQKLRAYKSLGK